MKRVMVAFLKITFVALVWGDVYGQQSRFGLHRIDSQFVGEYDSLLMDETAQTGVQWIIIRAHWAFIEPQPPAPVAFNVPGYRSGIHSYDWLAIDAAVTDARSRRLNVVLQLTKAPDWATGAPDGCGWDLGESRNICGLITNFKKDYFKLAWEDFCYSAAIRYSSQVAYFILWNEPNLRPNFNPEQPYDNVVNEYWKLILLPGSTGIKTGKSTANVVGPEITTLNDDFWGDWLDNGLDPILRYFGDQLDVLSVHSYNTDALTTILKMNRIREELIQHGWFGRKSVWLTEFNFRNGTCNLPDNLIASQVNFVYNRMDTSWWTRAFYFQLRDNNNQDCGFGLLHSQEYGLSPYSRKVLYTLFQNSIIGGVRPRRRP